MKQEIKLPDELWDGVELPAVLALKKGPERRNQLRQIVVASLEVVAPQRPTARNLQKLSRIRRKAFLPLLKYLLGRGQIARDGSGTRGDPYTYRLPESRR